MTDKEMYMLRCLQLARLGEGAVAPNPMVGAVLVHNAVIIGEGYHSSFGLPHAEVNCLASVAKSHLHLISSSTLYVSLEPCSHFGKTPPCADLIIKEKIPHVVIGCKDSFKQVNGSGIQKLKAAGVKVEVGVLEDQCRLLNKRFFTFHNRQRPYIFLKWATSLDGFISGRYGTAVKISNSYSDIITHKLRASASAILIGKNTVVTDNPSLTTRHWAGKNALRIVIDVDLKLASTARIFTDGNPTIIVNQFKEGNEDQLTFLKINPENVLPELMSFLYKNNLNSVIIEGGSFTLQSFIDAGLWDEAVVISNCRMIGAEGIKAPTLHHHKLLRTSIISSDSFAYYQNVFNELL